MGENTKIEWATHTFNPWWGCAKVILDDETPDQMCVHCYAADWARRWGVKWGPKADRRISSEKIWGDPVRWNRQALESGEVVRVFCASMADVFDERPDLDVERARLFRLIEATPALTWLLLTKRPQNVMRMVPESWRSAFPRNVWMGTSVGTQKVADIRIPHLLTIPAAIRFLSCEPLLEEIGIDFMLHRPCGWSGCGNCGNRPAEWLGSIDWVIGGFESGPRARVGHPAWARTLRDQCSIQGVPFLWKQNGEWGDFTATPPEEMPAGNLEHRVMLASGELIGGGRGDDGMVDTGWRERGAAWMVRVGKKAAGRLLDGVEHNAFPVEGS